MPANKPQEGNTLPKAYSYMRFSTPEQAKGDSKRRQALLAEEYAKENGLELDRTLTFRDFGVSAFRGANVEIGKLGEFMEAIRRKEVESGSFLLVESLDRISRDQILPAQNIFTQIILEGVTIVTLADRRVYSADLVNKAPFLLIEAIVILIRANEESETKSKRLKASWVNRRSNISTKPMTSLGPAWLKYNKKARKFEIIESRAKIIRRIFEEHLSGKGSCSIARGLRNDKVPTWTLSKGQPSIWREAYICKILKSTSVIGRLTTHVMDNSERWKRIPLSEVADYYPSVISEELFYKVQEVNRKFKSLYKGPVTIKNIFASLGRCSCCGSIHSYRSRGTGYSYLICYSYTYNLGCDLKPISYYPLERIFIEAFKKALYEFPPANRVIKKIHSELSQVRKKINNANSNKHKFKLPINSKTGSTAIDNDFSNLDDTIKKCQIELVELSLKSKELGQQLIDGLIKDFVSVTAPPVLNREEVNRVLKSMCCSILIKHGEIEVTFKQGPILLIQFDKDGTRFHYKSTDYTEIQIEAKRN